MYTVRIFEPFERDDVFEFDTLESVRDFLTKNKYKDRGRLYHVEVYLTPTPINVYELMGVKE